MANIKCTHCGGTGLKIDAHALRVRRTDAGCTLLEVSKKMGISIQYLSDLERGKRNWDEELLNAFNKAVPA